MRTLLFGLGLSLLSLGCGGPDGNAEQAPDTAATAPEDNSGDDLPPAWIQLSSLTDRGGRVVSPSLASDGFALPGGGSLSLDVTVKQASSLRFAVALRPQSQELVDQLPRRLELRWDDQLLPIGELPTDNQDTTLHEIPLPGTAGPRPRSHRLSFSVPPGPGQLIIHGPVIRPLHQSARRPDPDRPDVILFLADTFRADDLDHPGLTPRLNAFAEGARSFSRARSPSTWTLPSVASLLYGVAPGQHGGVHLSRQPASPAATLAETFAAAGYRTAAVTDSAFVSRRYQLDRGFEWFQELHHGSLPNTLDVAEQLLDADDGRPLLLLVHSYHTHTPYRPSPETRAALQRQLGIPDDGHDFDWFQSALDALEAEARQLGEATEDIRSRARTLAHSLTFLRRATVRELDDSFGRLLDLLAERGLDNDAVILFTSDHGEAFYEHGFLFHGRSVFDEVLRVPLLLRAPSLSPARVEAPVSLVDVTPTLATLAGLPLDPRWGRETLLAPRPDRAVFSFNWPAAHSQPLMSVVAKRLKVIAASDPESLSEGQLLSVFDLDADPGEQHDIAAERREQLASWIRGLAPRVAELLTPLGQAQDVELDTQHTELLRQLGYVGDDR